MQDMNIRIRPVSELSNAERQQLQTDLTWLMPESEAEWQADHWCITLEDNALTLSVLVERVDEAVFDESGEAILA